MPRYCKTKDKNGRTVYWQILRGGKRVRTTKKSATAKSVPSDCTKKTAKPVPRKYKKKPAKKSKKSSQPTKFASKAKKPTSKMTVKELKELAKKRGVYPSKGSGKNGRVLKKDIMNALKGKGKVPSKRSPSKGSPPKPDTETIFRKVYTHSWKEKFYMYRDKSSASDILKNFKKGNLYHNFGTDDGGSAEISLIKVFNDLLKDLRKQHNRKIKVVQFGMIDRSPYSGPLLMIYKIGDRYMIQKWFLHAETSIYDGSVTSKVYKKESLLGNLGFFSFLFEGAAPKSFFSYSGALKFIKDVSGDKMEFIMYKSPTKDTDANIRRDTKVINDFIKLIAAPIGGGGSPTRGPKYEFQYTKPKNITKQECIDIMCKLGIKSKKDYFKWMKVNHPDRAVNKKAAEAVWKKYQSNISDCNERKWYCP